MEPNELLDKLSFDGEQWSVEGIDLSPWMIRDIYLEFYGGRTMKTIEEILHGDNLYLRSYHKRAIYELASEKTVIDQTIISIYLLALKYQCLDMLASIENVSEYTVENLLPLDMNFVYTDAKKLTEFYKKYGKKSSGKCINKIKIPPNFKL